MRFRTKTYYLIIAVIVLSLKTTFLLLGQSTIALENPSFEDTPRHSKVPEGWMNCGFENESPPDIGPTRFFRAKTQASHGQTHLIMVTRDMGTWERIGSLLSSEMEANKCYDFSLDLARSNTYLSISRAAGSAINFNQPIRLRIWGANKQGALKELLAVSALVTHEEWQTYPFTLCPSELHRMLVLEVMYERGTVKPYGGNIMLDNCSDLVLNTEAKRNEEQLTAWAAETIPVFQAGNKSTNDHKSLDLVDTLILNQYMDEIRNGRIDIGLTNLSNYARDFAQQPWIIVVDKADQEQGKAKSRILRDRIKGMQLNAYLRVKQYHKLPANFQWLVQGLGCRL